MSDKNALHPCFGAVRCGLSRKTQLFSSNFLTAIFLTVAPNSIFAAEEMEACRQSWHQLSDDDFAVACEAMAFSDDLGDREEFSWFVFARVNQLIAERENGGLTGTDLAPIWMTWPTDVDTFSNAEAYNFDATPRVALEPSIEKKDLQAGHIGTADPDAFNEEVTRNRISYNYLVSEGLTTKAGVKAFFESNSFVNMPTGSIELKASWLQVTAGSPAPEGAFTFQFDHGEYWWRGLHIQIKMRSLSDPADVFYSEEPSWFWSTFEYNGNPGIKNIRENLTTQRAPLSEARIEQILSTVGLAGFGFDRYGPNGTQIRFTVNGSGQEPVLLGNSDMEDFAGFPNGAQPHSWRFFDSSCHSCHATASYNPATEEFFPFSVPIGSLDPSYYAKDSKGIFHYLGQGYAPLDFMWPIAFRTK